MTPIDVTVTALGQRFRVVGEFEPSSPAITAGPPDAWEPADPAEWGEHTVTLDGGTDDLCELLERVRPMGAPYSALDHILDLAEIVWLREQDEDRRAA